MHSAPRWSCYCWSKLARLPPSSWKPGKNLPAQAVAKRQPAVELKLILREEAELRRRSAHIRAGDREVQRSRRAFKKVTKGIACEVGLEDEVAEIIRSKLRGEAFQIEVPHTADIDAALQRMLAESVGQVVAELGGLRLRDAGFVPADGRKSGARAEVEGRKRMRGRMLADVHASKVKLRQRV